MIKSKQTARTNKITPKGKFERHFFYAGYYLFGREWAVKWSECGYIRRNQDTLRRWVSEGIPHGETRTVNLAIEQATKDKIEEGKRLLKKHGERSE